MKLVDVMNPRHLRNIFRVFPTKMKEYTFFSVPHGTISKIDHILGHKTNLNWYKKSETIPCILLDFHGLSLVFIHNKNNRKWRYPWKLNNCLLNDNWVKEESKKLKAFWNSIKWWHSIPKFMRHNENNAKMKIHRTKSLVKGLERFYTSSLIAHLRAVE